ncbi:hypothetical protein C8R45DRAFT_210082 [Mycena sanguinolenta]|nr:hypothetical protein C8R45DRAFT_210082 [Mycena sanguinolenta]
MCTAGRAGSPSGAQFVRFASAPTIVTSTARSTVSSVDSESESTFTRTATAPAESTVTRTEPAAAPKLSPIAEIQPRRRIVIRRRSSVPGTFPSAELSETDTDAGTVVDGSEDGGSEATPAPIIFSPQPSHVTIARIIPFAPSEDTYTFTTSPRSSSPAYSLEYSDDPSASNPVDIPSELEDDNEILVLSHGRRVGSDDRETTPKQMIIVLPPTPSESLQDWEGSNGDEVPPSPWMPLIPDQEPLDEWETVNAEEETPPIPPPKDEVFENGEENDDASISTGSTVTKLPVPTSTGAPPVEILVPAAEEPVPLITLSPIITVKHFPDPAPPTASKPGPSIPEPAPIPFPDPVPHTTSEPLILIVETSEDRTFETPEDPPASQTQPDAPHDPPAPVPDAEASQESDPSPTDSQPDAAADPYLISAFRTPPPSFEDLYGSDIEPDAADDHAVDTAEPSPTESAEATQQVPHPATPPAPSPAGSISRALGLRKEALELKARIATLDRKRKLSLSNGSGFATAAAVLAKVEMERAEKELAQVNEKAAGAFVETYNPPSASLYEFNTTGLTPEEAVMQTEARLEKLLLTPVPPVGTRPEDLVHDSPNRGALKIIMETSIKGRVVKQKLLNALNDNGLKWTEDSARPNVVSVSLPVSAADEPEPEPEPAAVTEPPARQDNEDEEDDTKEY